MKKLLIIFLLLFLLIISSCKKNTHYIYAEKVSLVKPISSSYSLVYITIHYDIYSTILISPSDNIISLSKISKEVTDEIVETYELKVNKDCKSITSVKVLFNNDIRVVSIGKVEFVSISSFDEVIHSFCSVIDDYIMLILYNNSDTTYNIKNINLYNVPSINLLEVYQSDSQLVVYPNGLTECAIYKIVSYNEYQKVSGIIEVRLESINSSKIIYPYFEIENPLKTKESLKDCFIFFI